MNSISYTTIGECDDFPQVPPFKKLLKHAEAALPGPCACISTVPPPGGVRISAMLASGVAPVSIALIC